MTLFVTLYFPTSYDRSTDPELADKNRPGTVINYLTHYFGSNFDYRNLDTSIKHVISAFKYSMTTKKPCPKFDRQNMTTETRILEIFEGHLKEVGNALKPFKHALFNVFKRPLNGLKICQTVL